MLIRYILEHGFEGLTNNLGVVVKEYDNYVVLNYSQIESPKNDPIVMECRGIILNKRTLQVVCSPFRRFFNYGETGCPENINFSECIISEKVDGSLIKVWHDPIEDKWQIATRGTAFAESEVNGFNITFRQLFLRAIKLTEEEYQDWARSYLSEDTTYLFELCCMENRVVTRYTEDTVVYLGSRKWNGIPGYQHILNEKQLKEINSRPAIHFKLKSWDEIQSAINKLEGLEEGFVVLDKNYTPICKIKSPLYVKAHRIRGEGLTPKRITDIVWENEEEEYLTYFPEDKKYFEPYINAYCQMIANILEVQTDTKGIDNQKAYAMIVKDLPIASIMFNIRKGMSVQEALEKVNASHRLNIIEKYLKEN